MPWSTIANNQTISRANLQDAINQGYFTLKAAFPADNKQITKDNADAYINIPNTSWPGYSQKSGGQLLTKIDLPTTVQNNGDFILDAQYGMYFTSMSGTVGGLPTFSFPVTGGNTTVSYNYTIPAQTITLGIDGSPAFYPINIAMYIDSALISSQPITSWPANYSFVLTNPLSAPQTIRFAINTGSVPPPPSYTFQGQSISNVLVVKSDANRMLATTGKKTFTSSLKYATTVPGNLYVSSNGGSSWTNTGLFGYWTSLSASDSGNYMLATQNNGWVYYSTNYGASWTRVNSLGQTNWSSSCVFNNGTMLVTSLFGGTGNVYRTTNNWSSYVNVAPVQGAYTTIAAAAGSGYAVLGSSGGGVWASMDFGTTFTQVPFGFPKTYTYPYSAKFSSDGSNLTLLYFSNTSGILDTGIYYSTNQGSNFTILNGSNVNTSTQGFWLANTVTNASSSYASLTTLTQLRRISNFTGISTVSGSPSGVIMGVDMNSGGSTILIGGDISTSGLFKSTNGGTSFQPL